MIQMQTKTWCVVLSVISIVAANLVAQVNRIGTIKGSVVDEATNRPIEFVSVVLHAKVDSAAITGTSTDKTGKFNFSELPAGEYFVKFYLIGYKRETSPSFKIDPQRKHVNLGQVALVTMPVELDEVLVTGERSMYGNSIDRKVYNVDQNLMSKAGTVSELLQNVPSVQVDLDGNISLRGSSSVLVMINGKTSPLMNRNSATVLQQMPASSIEKIELITNPSAKYKPDGTAGIINLVLKKNTALGINGTITANAGNQDRYNGTLRLNYNPGDFNIYGSYSLRKDSRNRINTDKRTQTDAASTVTLYDEHLKSFSSPLSHLVSLGFDYKLDDHNELGMSGNYFYNGFTRREDANKVLSDVASVILNQYDRNRIDYEYENEYAFRTYCEHRFLQRDQKLRLEFSASKAPEQEDNHYANVYLLPTLANEYDNTLIKNSDNKNELAVEYSNPLSERSNLEAGYVGEFNSNNLNYYAEYFDANRQQFVKDVEKTNRFLYDESIHALYATYKQSFGEFGFLGGFRAEQVHINSNLVTLDSTVVNDYLKIYPTVHLSYKLSQAAELQLSYSRRTRRPEADDLNPFPEYRDPRNISAGNPKLLPEFSHSVELGCQFQNDQLSVLSALYYRYTYNRFTSLMLLINDSTLLTTKRNLSNDQSGGVEVVVSGDLGDLISVHWSANAFLNQIDASNLGYSQKKSITTWSSNLTANANLTNTSRFQINSNYNSSRLTPQGKYSPSFVFNTGFRQELFDGKLFFVLTVADIFKTLKRELQLNTPSVQQTVVNMRDSRIVYFGLTYYSGAPPKKSREEQLKYDDNL